ncbi:hypothetical protein CAPTEDRAFT_201943 [Capitella teleta]|uniref:Uncharacterized protein n=1 Tax=Capitella teleta TaxID=283909 RepID=R7TCD5_CAPTE|nr:hypothetical protein CAPTEDRAFT_201943 [Capitella teleta]|eukprot:ELT91364.1 hypothetical protein CAPTEDRAFT_201943 [Capitella teleta]
MSSKVYLYSLFKPWNMTTVPLSLPPHRFDRPVDKRFVTENVQPDQFSQSSLNSRLGLGRGDPNARGSAGASGTWNPLAGGRGSPSPSAGGVGSSQSSPALSTRLKYGLVGSKISPTGYYGYFDYVDPLTRMHESPLSLSDLKYLYAVGHDIIFCAYQRR